MGRPKGCISTNKYTQEQANVLDRSVGAIPIGKYVNSKTKREDDNCFLEQKINGWRGSMDILINDIVIEFDSYYWHRQYRDYSEKDKRKEKAIKRSGYKFLRIRSGDSNIPTESQLRKILLNDFQHGASKRTITMKSWKDMEKKYANNGS